MIENSLTVEKIIELLNELNVLDPQVTAQLVSTRFVCNEKVADHPRFQVQVCPGPQTMLGFLGVLNGLCGTYDGGPHDKWGPITACFNEDRIVKFIKTADLGKTKIEATP